MIARFSIVALLLTPNPFSACAEDLNVLTTNSDGVAPAQLLEVDLKRQCFEYLEARRSKLASIKSRAECLVWQQERREFFVKQLGGFPKRTPLNPKVVGLLEGDGYSIEKVLFESRPGHHVSGNLYLPKGKPPFPAVLVPCGHSHNGKASGHYQRVSILMAKNGMAAFCYDPIGQGERYQMLDFEHDHEHFVSYKLKTPHPRVQYLCTTEHTAMGLGCILLGSNIAQYRIWDGMRAIDYLQSRDDIISDKIGCTGNSGGGTLTAYLMALDDRIVAAVPACFLTTFRRLIETKGPQDAEQNIFGQIAFGMDEADYVIMRAPKPTLICAARRDATFDIEGTWDLYRESKRFYARLGYPERVDISDLDHRHGFYLPQRQAAARWMHRWLKGQDKVIHEVDPLSLPDPISDKQLLELSEGDWTQEELYCSPEGQVLLMTGEKSVFEINSEQEETFRESRASRWKKLTDLKRRELVSSVIGSHGERDSQETREDTAFRSVGTIQRDGYTIEKLVLMKGSTIPLPALAFIPNEPKGPACLYLHGSSMKADAAPGGPIEKLVRQGQIVLAAELRGIGETEHYKQSWGRGRFGQDVQQILLAYLIGQSYVGLRKDDIVAWATVLATYRSSNEQPRELHLVAIGEAAIPALHATALHPKRFASGRLHEMIRSWSEVVRSPDNFNQTANIVHGVLQHYDLPDLIKLAGQDRIRVENTVDVMGERVVEANRP